MPISFHTLSIELVQLAFCPKHWQLPKNKVDRFYVEGEGNYNGHWETTIVQDSFPALLTLYGWKMNTDKIYGPSAWTDGISSYSSRTAPFYLVDNGALILPSDKNVSMTSPGTHGFLSSSAATSMTFNGDISLGMAPSGTASKSLVLAGTNYGRHRAFALRCLTQ